MTTLTHDTISVIILTYETIPIATLTNDRNFIFLSTHNISFAYSTHAIIAVIILSLLLPPLMKFSVP